MVILRNVYDGDVNNTERYTLEMLFKDGTDRVMYFDDVTKVHEAVLVFFDIIDEYKAYDNKSGDIVVPFVKKRDN